MVTGTTVVRLHVVRVLVLRCLVLLHPKFEFLFAPTDTVLVVIRYTQDSLPLLIHSHVLVKSMVDANPCLLPTFEKHIDIVPQVPLIVPTFLVSQHHEVGAVGRDLGSILGVDLV